MVSGGERGTACSMNGPVTAVSIREPANMNVCGCYCV